MKVIHFLAGLSLTVLLSACAAIRGGGEVEQGRQALLAGNYQAALGYFQQAEQTDPDYMYSAELREGVLSYLGRAQYLTGNYTQARQAFSKKPFPPPQRQSRTAILGPYVVSSWGPEGGTDEYPTRYGGNQYLA